jgi:hypothetical protein
MLLKHFPERLLRTVTLCGTMFAAISTAGCDPARPESYANPSIGLSLTYPSDWTTSLSKEVASKGAKQVGLELDPDELNGVFEHLVFGISKPFQAKGFSDNANLLVLAFQVDSTAECESVERQGFQADEAKDYLTTLPKGHLVPAKHFSAPGLHGYSAEFSLKDRIVLQHRYWYCHGKQAVLMQSTTATPEAEKAIREILRTIHVARQTPA